MTASLSQIEIVTLAVYMLGGHEKAIDTEDVAIKAYQMAPERFSWRKYPDQVNLEIVRVYLSDAKKAEKGNEWLEGSGKTGWSLTPRGLRWAKSKAAVLPDLDLSRERHEAGGGSVDEQRWRRERNRVTGTAAWAAWKGGTREAITVPQASEVFRIDSYAVGRIRSRKITRLLNLFTEDDEMARFLRAMSDILEQGSTEDE